MQFSIIFLVIFWIIKARGDEGYYVDTNAALIGDENLDLKYSPTILCNIETSDAYLSGTTDNLYITFVGLFSSSGPHEIGPFPVGAKNTVIIQLDRLIGELNSVMFQTFGSDGWLLSALSCRIASTWYVLENSNIWLESLSPEMATHSSVDNIYGDQLLDRQATSSSVVMAKSNYQISVKDTYNNFNAVGISST
eukprot:gene27046-35757_t